MLAGLIGTTSIDVACSDPGNERNTSDQLISAPQSRDQLKRFSPAGMID
jgi:hypothetical protein